MSATNGKSSDSLAAVDSSGAETASPVSAALFATTPTPPALAITSVTTSGATGFTLSGTATDSLGVSSVKVYKGSTLLGSATYTAATGAWSYSGTLAAGVDNTFQVKATDTAGAVATATYYAYTGGGQTLTFADASGDAASLSNTGGKWDTVYGSNGTIILNSSQASIVGEDDVVYFSGASGNAVSIYDLKSQSQASGPYDTIYGSNGLIILTDSLASIVGGGDSVYLYTTAASKGYGYYDTVSLYSTGGAWDTVSGSADNIFLTSAQTSLSGGDDFVTFSSGTGNAVSIYNTNGAADTVFGSNGIVALNGSQANIYGGDDVVYFSSAAGNAVSIFDEYSGSTQNPSDGWSTVVGSNGSITLNQSQAAIYGDANKIYLTQGVASLNEPLPVVSLANDSGDTIYNSDDAFGQVWLSSNSSNVTVVGDGVTLFIGDSLSSAITFNIADGGGSGITGDNGVVDLVKGSVGVSGFGNTIDVLGAGTSVEIDGVYGAANTVSGAASSVVVNDGLAKITSAGDTVQIEDDSTVSLTAPATSEAITVGHTLVGNYRGTEIINGFTLSDTLQLPSDLGNFQDLISTPGVLTESNGNTVIADTVYNGDGLTVTLTNFNSATLTAAQFKFV